MVIVYGTRFIGKLDRVPGKGYVVTKAFHVCNLPLVPLGGFIVLEGTEEHTLISGLTSFQGVPIPIRWASFGWGLARTIGWTVGLLAAMFLLPILVGASMPFGLLLGPPLAIALFVAHWRTRHGLLASPERANALLRTLDGGSATTLPVARVIR